MPQPKDWSNDQCTSCCRRRALSGWFMKRNIKAGSICLLVKASMAIYVSVFKTQYISTPIFDISAIITFLCIENGSMWANSDLTLWGVKSQPVIGHVRPSRFSTLNPRSMYDLHKAFKLTNAFKDGIRLWSIASESNLWMVCVLIPSGDGCVETWGVDGPPGFQTETNQYGLKRLRWGTYWGGIAGSGSAMPKRSKLEENRQDARRKASEERKTF